MTDIMNALYDHVQENEMPKYMMTEKHREVRGAVDVQRELLLEKFPGLEGPLDDFLDILSHDYSLELEAMFQAAFSFGLRLPQSL